MAEFDYDVFLSYSTQDAEAVHALAERLRADGVRVWLDRWAIEPGDLVGLKVQQGIEQSRTLILCMSEAYFESAWATLEHHSLLFHAPRADKRTGRFGPAGRTRSWEARERLPASCRVGGSRPDDARGRDVETRSEARGLRGHKAASGAWPRCPPA